MGECARHNIPDRLWFIHSKWLMQREEARIASISRRVYIEIDCGIIQHLAGCLILNLSLLYGVAISNFLNEFNQFLYDGQANWIKD